MTNKSYVGEFNGRRLYTALRLDHRLRLWAPTSASRAISAVAELLLRVSLSVQVRVIRSTGVFYVELPSVD